ncbi:MAG: hypothetical protein QOJ29_3025 [Thermoleophilaceae bacterium]|jgi:hypothetical protein|nr:hypothetical protein [Thermoleophilaceae bacterium]
MPVQERFWTHRLRWRMRGGSWLWPAFALSVLVDAVILHFLPPVGSEQQINAPTGLNLVGDVIVAGFTNLFLVAVVAPWLARRLTERPAPEGQIAPPYELHFGRTAAILMAVAGLGLIVAGLGNRPLIVSETKATETNARLVREYVLNHGNAEMRRNLETANTARLASDFFRTCISNDHRTRYWCFFVDTKVDPAKLSLDSDSRPNSLVAPGG